MDKYEYKVRAEEIRTLIEERKYPEAMAIADTIDWRKVKSVSMLCDISDLYNVNRKFDVARDVLELAYERHPEGRRIVYSLCELSIKMEDIIQAVEYYKEFVKIAPRDSGRYILQYKIYQAQEVGIDECIAVLKELKKRDYREKWAYELAYLYHRAGLATECVEECDELILWFGEGTFVKKAMELKMLHTPLTATQKEKYDLMNDRMVRREAPARPQEPEIRVKPVDTSIYNTMNLQKELAMSLEAVLKKDKEEQEAIVAVHNTDTGAIQVDEIKAQYVSQEESAGNDFENINVIDLMDEGEDRVSVPEVQEEMGDTRVFNPNDISRFSKLIPDAPEIPTLETVTTVNLKEELKREVPVEEPVLKEPEIQVEEEETTVFVEEDSLESVAPVVKNPLQAEAPSGFEELLSQEYDGQISLVVPEEEPIEKQITGQLSIEDVLAEWERMKRENEQKRQEEVRQRVLEHTGNLMKEFDESVHEEIKDFEELIVEDDEEENEDKLEEAIEDNIEELFVEESENENNVPEECFEDSALEDIFEELEEIKEDEEDEEDEDKESSFGMKAALATAAVGAGALAAGITAKASAGEASVAAGASVASEVAKEAVSVAGDVVGGVVSAAGELVDTVSDVLTNESEEPAKRTPYGANRFEYEDEEVEVPASQEEKTVKRVVQDYNELLYGEEFTKEDPINGLVEESVENEELLEESIKEESLEEESIEDFGFLQEEITEEAVSADVPEEVIEDDFNPEDFLFEEAIPAEEPEVIPEEVVEPEEMIAEQFDPQDFINDMFETDEVSVEETTEEQKSQNEDAGSEEEFDYGFDFTESEVFDEPEQVVESEENFDVEASEEESSEAEFQVEQFIEESVEEPETSTEEDFLQGDFSEGVEESNADSAGIEESQVEKSSVTEDAPLESDDISQRMEALASKVFHPAEEYIPKEEPLTDTFTIVTPEMQEEMMNPHVSEPEMIQEPVSEEVLQADEPNQEEVVIEEPVPVMPMVTQQMLDESMAGQTLTDTFVTEPAILTEQEVQNATDLVEAVDNKGVEEKEESVEVSETTETEVPVTETNSEQIFSEDQYAKALEEQLMSVAPDSFSAVDENTFERIEPTIPEAYAASEGNSGMDGIGNLSDETDSQVENFYERQAEIERTKISREFTETEERLYGSFLRTKKAKDQLIYAIDNISMASYTGNIIITGDDQKENLELARNLLKEVQQNDDNFSGVPGKISADSLNHKEVESILRKVENGAVIIENAGILSKETVEDMTSYLEKENRGIIVILLDQKMSMDKMLSANPALRSNFNARIDIEEMTSQELSAYGKSYAYEKEYAIDEMGMLALFTRIEELQTMGHVVMPDEVEKIVDAAIKKANRKNVKHFTDVILNKRYDEEDMIVLREKDF